MAFSSRITFGARVNTSAPVGPGSVSGSAAVNNERAWKEGDGADEANVVWLGSQVVGTSTVTLNFGNGSLTDPLGNTVSMDRVKAIYAKNTGAPVLLSGTIGTVTAADGIIRSLTLLNGEEVQKASGGATDYNGGFSLALSLVSGTVTTVCDLIAIGVEDSA